MKNVYVAGLSFVMLILFAGHGIPQGRPTAEDVALIKPAVRTGFSHAGWKYDRYTELPSLDAGSRMILADLEGPGVIRHIHMTRHQPKEQAARGVVLEIYFDSGNMNWFERKIITAGDLPSAENWRTLTYDLEPWAGRIVCIVLQVSYGGPFGVNNEEAFFDEMSLVFE